jgi:polyether ionophore transport system permease protein
VTRLAGSPLGTGTIGLRSVFTKALRDSRRALAIVLAFEAIEQLTGGAAIAAAFGTPETRAQAAALANGMPAVVQGLVGTPIGLTSLGGFIEWRYFSILALLMPVWSILALSGTLAGEGANGSLELIATAGISRRRLALEKLAGHVVVVGLAMAGLAFVTSLTGVVFGTLPGDEISVGAAASYAVLAALLLLAPGAIAFAAAPFLGRGGAAGLAAVLMVGAFVLNAYRASVPAFDALTPLSWYSWTANHVPLGGREDWLPLAGLTALTAGLLVAGVVAFERRDIGSPIRLRTPHLPRLLLGLREPTGRAFGERLQASTLWGVGIGLYVLVVASSAATMANLFHDLPAIERMVRFVYPDMDLTSVAGTLQLVFVSVGMIFFGFVAATLAAGWASDEISGRLEVLLATPWSRAVWVVRSGLGTYLGVVLSAGIVAVAAGIGAANQGGDAVTPAIGSMVFALYGVALVGIGIAVAGWTRASLAAPVVIAVTMGSYLISLFASPLKWPAWVTDLALSEHFGKPLLGHWDLVGVVASIALAVGGLVVGAWGFSRRDLRG